MAYTRHGHHIKGTPVETPFLGKIARCGGPTICAQCRIDAGILHHPSNTQPRKKDV